MKRIEKLNFHEGSRPPVSVGFDKTTGEIWLTRRQISELFDTSNSTVAEQTDKILDDLARTEAEREKYSQVFPVEYWHARSNKIVTADIRHYSLDVVLAVGYRVRGERGAEFRRWASGVFRDHLVAGISLNHRRLVQNGIGDLVKIVEMAQKTFSLYGADPDKNSIASLVESHMKTWATLAEYDAGTQGSREGLRPAKVTLSYEEAKGAIDLFKEKLREEGQPIDMFGIEREEGLRRIFSTLEQSFFGVDAYSTVEEKAAALLYFVVKDHPFQDGNKRIATLLFLDYLSREGVALPDRDVSTATLFVAGSDAKERDVVLSVIRSVIRNNALGLEPKEEETPVFSEDEVIDGEDVSGKKNDDEDDPDEEISPGMS